MWRTTVIIHRQRYVVNALRQFGLVHPPSWPFPILKVTLRRMRTAAFLGDTEGAMVSMAREVRLAQTIGRLRKQEEWYAALLQ